MQRPVRNFMRQSLHSVLKRQCCRGGLQTRWSAIPQEHLNIQKTIWPSPMEWVAVLPFAVLGGSLRVSLCSVPLLPDYIPSTFACNILGTFVMGMAAARPAGIDSYERALHRGVSVGFCGCLTTFSAWIVQAASRPCTIQMMFDVLSTLIGCVGAWKLGKRVSRSALANMIGQTDVQAAAVLRFRALAISLVLSGGVFLHEWAAMDEACDAVSLWTAALHGPGAILRLMLTTSLNGLGYCCGTITANMSAVAIASWLSELATADGSSIATAFSRGFCGSLSTVSSFINDFMSVLQRQSTAAPTWALLYITLSLLGATFSVIGGSHLIAIF